MKFIITGGAGFIGHNVVRLLELWGHTCIVVDNFTNYGFIPKEELNYLISERLKRINSPVYNIDLLDIDQFTQFANYKIDGIIHLASFPRQKVVSQNPILAANVMGTGLVHLLELAKKFKIPKFVYISSSMVYGDFNNDVLETNECNPIGQYGIMKYMGEWLVKDYARLGHFDYSIIRPSAVYGEYDVEDRVVSKFMLSAIRNQTLNVRGSAEVLDFTYVDDTAQGIALAATKDIANNKIYNITRADSKIYTLLDAANIAVNIAGQGQIQIEDRDLSFPTRGRLSIDRAVEELGYNPSTNVEQGFQKYHDWFKSSDYWSKLL